MATQQEIATNIVAQLRVLDPSISAEIGTPERKIIDSFAQAIAEAEAELGLLDGALDFNSKTGADLDKFFGIFRFGRQQGARSTGFVTFSRTTATPLDIRIPKGTQLIAPTPNVTFRTTADVVMVVNTMSVLAPVEAITLGTSGNVSANQITTFGTLAPRGIEAVTNVAATSGGADQETDDEYKIRFQNTVFRNLSGTYDQYLATAASLNNSSKANVVGPISRYREYLQVPAVDDASVDPSSGIGGNGSAGNYTSALSTIPYSKYTWATVPYFVTNGKSGADITFYRQDTDFAINSPGLDAGDAYRDRIEGVGPVPSSVPYQPNLTFTSVLPSTSIADGLKAGDVVLFEHSYTSSASRNDFTHGVTNCVDVYVNGESLNLATTVIPKPTITATNVFSATSTNRYYADNFRRIGDPEHRPIVGNIFTPLFSQPVRSVPNSLVVGNFSYYLGTHYWAVEDVSSIGNTIRTRNGIEWSVAVPGKAGADPDLGPYTGDKIQNNAAATIEVANYTYDVNIPNLQAALDGVRQVTTDVLGHRAKTRYFQLDITIMYDSGANVSDVNNSIYTAVQDYFDGLYFGSAIQLSDILQHIHNVTGVDNVRWSREVIEAQHPGDTTATDSAGNRRDRIIEVSDAGNSRTGLIVDRTIVGDATTNEQQKVYIVGGPTSGTYKLTFGSVTTASIAYNADSATVAAAAIAAGISNLNVSGTGTWADPFIFAWTTTGAQPLTVATASFGTGTYVHNSDFFLNDDELGSLPTTGPQTVPGIVIRNRAQNTWNQL